MESGAPRRRPKATFEYALFAAILLMTVSGVFLYQAIAQDPALSGFTTYLIGTYLVFLALAFGQLNALHRKRPPVVIDVVVCPDGPLQNLGGAVPLDRSRRPVGFL